MVVPRRNIWLVNQEKLCIKRARYPHFTHTMVKISQQALFPWEICVLSSSIKEDTVDGACNYHTHTPIIMHSIRRLTSCQLKITHNYLEPPFFITIISTDAHWQLFRCNTILRLGKVAFVQPLAFFPPLDISAAKPFFEKKKSFTGFVFTKGFSNLEYQKVKGDL